MMSAPGPIGSLRLRVEIAEHMKIVRSYTHCILTRKDIGTAVAFRLGERLFLITAGHILTESFEVYLFAGEGPAARAEVLSYHYHPESSRTSVHLDFGFIEIRNVPSLTACQIEQLHVGEATPALPGDGAMMFIAGCPVSGFEPHGRPPAIGLGVVSGYLRGGNEAVLEVDYEREGHSVTPDGGSFQTATFPATPGGFSGGGVWALMRVLEGDVFQPQKHVKMSGTQFQWDPDRRGIYAMRPRFTLPFFFDWYPELRVQYGYVLDRLT